MAERKKILIIEDEGDIAELLEYNLHQAGFDAEIASDGETGIQKAQSFLYSLIILDIMLPGVDGITVCRRIREGDSHSRTPILMLTAKSEETDVVLGLELGADDYMTKPFSPKELVARVRSLLRRAAENRPNLEPRTNSDIPGEKLNAGPISMDFARHEVTLRDEPIILTLAEFKLLAALAKTPGRVRNRDELVDELTGGDTYIIGRNIDVHIRSIRKKLGGDADLIQTIRGVGYRWRD